MNKPVNKSINSFLQNLLEKNYREANASLHAIVEEKLKQKIQSLVSQKNPNKLDK